MSNHARLSRTMYSAWGARRTLWVLATLLLITAGPGVGRAQHDTISFDGTTNTSPCGTGCCLKFTDTINQPTGTIDIILHANPLATDCFNHICWTSQGTATETFQEGPLGDSDFQIYVTSPTDPMWSGIFPVIKTVYICGSYDCLKNWNMWSYTTGPFASGSGVLQPLYIQSCLTEPPCSSGCSYIVQAPAGTPYVHCGTEISYWNQSGSSVSCLTFHIYPSIDWDHPCGGTPGHPNGVRCPINPPGYDHCFFDTIPGGCDWSESEIFNEDSSCDITFCAPEGCGVTSCSDPFTIFIPYCANTIEPRVIQLIDPPPGPGCNPDYTTIYTALKPATEISPDDGDNSGGQNYPNPIDAASGFNTTIPFVTSAGGIASISIVDAKGVKVLTDNESILGSGHHFFYFTAKDLPSGTYYYTIEFPQGVVIASKTMLVVK